MRPISIPEPCPFVPAGRNKNDAGYFCKSCSKTVVDLRGKSLLELEEAVEKKVCGIFDTDQLASSPKLKFTRSLAFKIMAFASLLGFTVKPVTAQVDTLKKNTVAIERVRTKPPEDIPTPSTEQAIKTNTSRKGLFRRRKQRTIGCPAF